VKAGVERTLRHRAIAGEAVKDDSRIAGAFLCENPESVFLRLPGVNHDRQAPAARQADLRPEDRLLDRARREVVVVIEADLAHRPGRGGLPQALVDEGSGPLRVAGKRARRVRMHANRQADVGPGHLDARRAPAFLLVIRAEDDERRRDAGGAGAIDDRLEVAGELGSGEMTMAVDHRTRAPGGTSRSKPRRIGWPPSGLPASTIPLDSTPISVAGCRFATITIVRPTSCSG